MRETCWKVPEHSAVSALTTERFHTVRKITEIPKPSIPFPFYLRNRGSINSWESRSVLGDQKVKAREASCYHFSDRPFVCAESEPTARSLLLHANEMSTAAVSGFAPLQSDSCRTACTSLPLPHLMITDIENGAL